jgi:hypothetical protein
MGKSKKESGWRSLVEMGVGDEDVICFGYFVNVQIFRQDVWTLEPGVEKDSQPIGAETKCCRSCE